MELPLRVFLHALNHIVLHRATWLEQKANSQKHKPDATKDRRAREDRLERAAEGRRRAEGLWAMIHGPTNKGITIDAAAAGCILGYATGHDELHQDVLRIIAEAQEPLLGYLNSLQRFRILPEAKV